LLPVAAVLSRSTLPRSSPARAGGDSSIDSHGSDHRRIPVVVHHRAGLPTRNRAPASFGHGPMGGWQYRRSGGHVPKRWRPCSGTIRNWGLAATTGLCHQGTAALVRRHGGLGSNGSSEVPQEACFNRPLATAHFIKPRFESCQTSSPPNKKPGRVELPGFVAKRRSGFESFDHQQDQRCAQQRHDGDGQRHSRASPWR